jgi:hypothetical protein
MLLFDTETYVVSRDNTEQIGHRACMACGNTENPVEKVIVKEFRVRCLADHILEFLGRE